MERLRAALRAARERLRALIAKRHAAKPGGKRRRKLGEEVRLAREAKQRLVKELKAAKKPDFNGCPQNVTDAIKRVILHANHAGLYVTATTNGAHAPTSYHYSGRAVDVAAPMNAAGITRMANFQRELAKEPGRYAEVFGPVNDACVKNGSRLTLAEGTALENQHDNHVHIAIA